MTASDNFESLAKAAAALAANPRELSAWWAIAETFASSGDSKASIGAFADLGNAASDLAAVGLAVACALRLKELKATRESKALVTRIAMTHCKGSKRVDKKADVPPTPPRATKQPIVLAKDLASAKTAATSAMRDAARLAKSRAPKVVPPTPLIRYLSPGDLQTLLTVMSIESFKRGDVVVDAGDDADALYWIARGSTEVSVGNTLLGELRSDSFFGEIALVGASTRTARVACQEESDILRIPAKAIEDLALRAPSVAQVLASHARARLLSNVLRTSELFRRLSSAEKSALLPRFKSSYLDAGEAVLTKGVPNDSLYVVVTGSCEVREGKSCVQTLSAGDGFGEMSMLGRKEATFDVVAANSCLLLHVSRDEFDEIAVAHPSLLAEVYKLLVDRERENASDAVIHEADDLVI